MSSSNIHVTAGYGNNFQRTDNKNYLRIDDLQKLIYSGITERLIGH